MEPKIQTKVTNDNRQDFLTSVYATLTKTKSELIQLEDYHVSEFILADCGAWHYKNLWPDQKIIGLETMWSIKQYHLDRSQFTSMIDDRDYNNIKWPSMIVDNCALIFDHSPVLKYRTIDDIISVVFSAANHYQPKIIVLRLLTIFVDDCRLIDRLTSLSKLLIPGYVVTKFVYDTVNLEIAYRKQQP